MGYIDLILAVKSGCKNSNITYFGMIIQIPDVNHKGVSCSKDLQEEFIRVEENHFPIKRINIKRKRNYRDKSKIDIEINKVTIWIEQNEVPFKYSKNMGEIFPTVTIRTIPKEKNNNDCILLHCFINVEDLPSKFPYSPISINKKVVVCNDNTDKIKLTL